MEEFINKKASLGVLYGLKYDEDKASDSELAANKVLDEAIKSLEAVPGMTDEEKQSVFDEVHKANILEDARRQVKDFFDGRYFVRQDRHYDENNLPIDYDYLAMQFEKKFDCNIAENDVWQNVIATYVKELITKAEETYAKEHPEKAPMKIAPPTVSIDEVRGTSIGVATTAEQREDKRGFSMSESAQKILIDDYTANLQQFSQANATSILANAEADRVAKMKTILPWVRERAQAATQSLDTEMQNQKRQYYIGFYTAERDAYISTASMLEVLEPGKPVDARFEIGGKPMTFAEFVKHKSDPQNYIYEIDKANIDDRTKGNNAGSLNAYKNISAKIDETLNIGFELGPDQGRGQS